MHVTLKKYDAMQVFCPYSSIKYTMIGKRYVIYQYILVVSFYLVSEYLSLYKLLHFLIHKVYNCEQLYIFYRVKTIEHDIICHKSSETNVALFLLTILSSFFAHVPPSQHVLIFKYRHMRQ